MWEDIDPAALLVSLGVLGLMVLAYLQGHAHASQKWRPLARYWAEAYEKLLHERAAEQRARERTRQG